MQAVDWDLIGIENTSACTRAGAAGQALVCGAALAKKTPRLGERAHRATAIVAYGPGLTSNSRCGESLPCQCNNSDNDVFAEGSVGATGCR